MYSRYIHDIFIYLNLYEQIIISLLHEYLHPHHHSRWQFSFVLYLFDYYLIEIFLLSHPEFHKKNLECAIKILLDNDYTLYSIIFLK